MDEYKDSSSPADSGDEDEEETGDTGGYNRNYEDSDESDSPTIELQPVPLSKNAGNRFVSIVWDRIMDTQGRDVEQLHEDRTEYTEEHVLFCRKANLYNETFNTDSMVDVVWSLPILSSDLRRMIGHAMVLESTSLSYVEEFLERDPWIRMFKTGDDDDSRVERQERRPLLFRWRHIKDYTLRRDDGRFGYPCMCLALQENYRTSTTMDPDELEELKELREDLWEETMEYLITSEKVIAGGPLHTATESKKDPESIAVGDFILFNAKDREDAIAFSEGLPLAEHGAYESLKAYFYNRLDITGKFISEDPLRDTHCEQMKEAMQYWGYPVEDDQTPWLNF